MSLSSRAPSISQQNAMPTTSQIIPNGSRYSSTPSDLSRKRLRDSSTASTVSKFSAPNHNKLLRWYGNECWHCGAKAAIQDCHIIAQRDRSFQEYKDRGFISFDSLADYDNGIRLCTLCHPQFDDLQCPGIIFFPHNLRFFIDSELRDYERRLERAQTGYSVPRRRCPTAEEYLDNQINTAAVPEDAIGGLYDRYNLRDFLPRFGRVSDYIPVLEPKQWHGSPMATIMRVFLIHRSVVAGINLISQSHRESLRELQDLYLRPDPNTIVLEEGTAGEDQLRQTTLFGNRSPTEHHAQDRHGALNISGRGLIDRPPNVDTQSGGARDSAIDIATVNHNKSQSSIEILMSPKPLKRHRSLYSEDDLPAKRGKREKRPQFIPKEIPWSWGPESTSIDKAIWLPRMLQWDKRGVKKEETNN